MQVGENSYSDKGSVTAGNGYISIKQNANNNMAVYSDLTNTGRVTQVVSAGNMTLGSTAKNSSKGDMMSNNGGFYAVTLGSNSKMDVTSEFNSDGETQLRNKGANGMSFNGTLNGGNKRVDIVNEAGDLTVNGRVTSADTLTIWNEGRNTNIGSSAHIESTGTEGAIVHEGNGTYSNYGYLNKINEFK